jgi:phosphatidate cytidylyltransferase
LTHRQIRVAIGSALVGLIVAVVVVDRILGQALAVPLVATSLGIAALWEFGRLCGARLPDALRRGLLAGGGISLVAGFALWGLLPDAAPAAVASAPLLALLPVVAALIRLRWRTGVVAEDLASLGLAALAILVTVVPILSLVSLAHLREGVLFAVVVVLGSKLNDIGGYLVGTTFGRHRLCPGISPNKTWEGALGGLLAGVVGTALLVRSLTPLGELISLPSALLLGLLLGVATQLGDLFESALKRAGGVKDSASLIPTFGGVLDLVDSLIFAAPLGYAMGHAWLGPP